MNGKPYDEPWWKLDFSTLLLIGGLVLFNIGAFIHPTIVDRIVGALDVRYWPWWYILPVLVFLGLAIKWCSVYSGIANNTIPLARREIELTFVVMTMTIAVEVGIFLILCLAGLVSTIFSPLYFLVNFGYFSFRAAIVILCLLAATGWTLFTVWMWYDAVRDA